MMSQEANDLITRTGPKDPCGKLMRMYWQPAALVDELPGPHGRAGDAFALPLLRGGPSRISPVPV